MKIEFYKIGNRDFVRHYDETYQIKNKQTGEIFDEANDLVSQNFEYELTDILKVQND